MAKEHPEFHFVRVDDGDSDTAPRWQVVRQSMRWISSFQIDSGSVEYLEGTFTTEEKDAMLNLVGRYNLQLRELSHPGQQHFGHSVD